MRILSVNCESNWLGIKALNLDMLMRVLRAYAAGSCSQAFLEGMRDDISRQLTTRQDFIRDYSRDPYAGLFRRTEVSITTWSGESKKPSQSLYILQIMAEADDETERLALRCGFDLALWSDEVLIGVLPDDDKSDDFEFDFDAVVRTLSAAGVHLGMSGEAIAEAVMADARRSLSADIVASTSWQGLKVSIGIRRWSVVRPVNLMTDEWEWRHNGAVISGPLREDSTLEAPQLVIGITEAGRSGRLVRRAIIDDRVEQSIHALTNLIADAFSIT